MVDVVLEGLCREEGGVWCGGPLFPKKSHSIGNKGWHCGSLSTSVTGRLLCGGFVCGSVIFCVFCVCLWVCVTVFLMCYLFTTISSQ